MLAYLLILFLSIPTGLLIAWLTRDELIEGFGYINSFFLISFILAINYFRNDVVTLTLGFISIVSYISVLKRFDNKWAVQRRR